MRRVDQLRKLRHALVGTRRDSCEELSALQQKIGLGGILAEPNCSGLIPNEIVMTALRLLCEEVKPRFPK